jgi:hypothetical protein
MGLMQVKAVPAGIVDNARMGEACSLRQAAKHGQKPLLAD